MPEHSSLIQRSRGIAFLGSYLPRACGIATLSHDLATAVARQVSAEQPVIVAAMNDQAEGYAYPDIVKLELRQEHPIDYSRAAEFLNFSGIDIVSLQHEYGIYVGVTHPAVVRKSGESYRLSLQRRVRKLGLEEHVLFHPLFVEIDELLAEGRGCLVPPGDSAALAREIIALLDDEVKLNAMRKRAYLYCRSMVWSSVARNYLDLFDEVRSKAPTRFPIASAARSPLTHADLPPPKIDHLARLTDDTGPARHARHSVPDWNHVYGLDDAAATMVAATKFHAIHGDDASRSSPRPASRCFKPSSARVTTPRSPTGWTIPVATYPIGRPTADHHEVGPNAAGDPIFFAES